MQGDTVVDQPHGISREYSKDVTTLVNEDEREEERLWALAAFICNVMVTLTASPLLLLRRFMRSSREGHRSGGGYQSR